MLKFAFVCALISIVALLFLAHFIPPQEAVLEELDSMLNERVRIEGVVDSVRHYKNMTFLSLIKSEAVRVVVFDNINEIKTGDKIEIIGRVSKYRGRTEIIADDIRMKKQS